MYIINNVDDSLGPLLGRFWHVLVNFGLAFGKYGVTCFRPSSAKPPKRMGPVLSCEKAPKLRMEGHGARQPCSTAISSWGGGGGGGVGGRTNLFSY